jgi:methylenetetrahydrofolate--tRNA-(uracil-5-)-methyltransferase
MQVAALAVGSHLEPAPRASALGSLVNYITNADAKRFQPANITFDLLPAPDEQIRRRVRDKKERHRMVCEQALTAFENWWRAAETTLQSRTHVSA